MKNKIILFQGNDEQQLLNALAEIDEITTIDNVILNNQKGKINFIRRKGRLYWELSVEDNSFQKIRQRGKTLQSFLSMLNDAETKEFGSNFSVICYQKTLPKRAGDGRIYTTWFLIDPYEPYIIKDEKCILQTMDLLLSKEEYSAAMEVGIAFYDIVNEIFYPLKTEALPTVCRFMDCSSSLIQVEDCRLGPAFLLATKIANKMKVYFLIEKIKGIEKTRPILSIVGKNYISFSHKKIMQDVLDVLSKTHIYTIKKWEITGDASNIIVGLASFGYNHCLRLSIGRTSGNPVTVTAYTKIGNSYIHLMENSLTHRNNLDTANLMEGILNSYDEFEKLWEILSTIKLNQTEINSLLLLIKKPLGKFRFQELSEKKMPLIATDFITFLCNETNVRLNCKEKRLLEKGYFSIIKKIVSIHSERKGYAYVEE